MGGAYTAEVLESPGSDDLHPHPHKAKGRVQTCFCVAGGHRTTARGGEAMGVWLRTERDRRPEFQFLDFDNLLNH